MSKKVISMNEIKSGRIEGVEWVKIGVKYKNNGDMVEYPLKIWQNLECILQKYDIQLRLNDITHEVVSNQEFTSANGRLTDIYSLQVEEGLNMGREEVVSSMSRIAEKNRFNPFVEMIEANENDDREIIKELFSCLDVDANSQDDLNYYFTIFVKWLLNVVKMANNTLEKKYNSHGVLVLQGKQGLRKTTFCRNLAANGDWFKSDESLDPNSKDSIMVNTRYVLVEWGELDSTMKNEQAALKKFITSESDEYRAPYERCTEKYPRRTSYIGTVNKKDFLKDETGSRRFWIIPLKGIDIERQEKINMEKLWGAVYHLWKSGEIKDYLEPDELEKLQEINANYNYEDDVSITLNEKLDWDMPESEWGVYSATEISNYLLIKEKKKIKVELLKRGIEYKVYKVNGKPKRGFKVPRIEVILN